MTTDKRNKPMKSNNSEKKIKTMERDKYEQTIQIGPRNTYKWNKTNEKTQWTEHQFQRDKSNMNQEHDHWHKQIRQDQWHQSNNRKSITWVQSNEIEKYIRPLNKPPCISAQTYVYLWVLLLTTYMLSRVSKDNN